MYTTNRSSQQCVQTLECEQPTCCLFAPGNQHVVVGTQKGNLLMYYLPTGQIVQTIEGAHADKVTGVTLVKRCGDVASVGLDKRLVVYDFELFSDGISKFV